MAAERPAVRRHQWPRAWPTLLLVLAATLAALVPPAHAADDARHPGSLDMSPALRAMQADDSQNPAMLWVASGRDRWAAECARCHGGQVETAMRGVAARYPQADATSGRVITLNQRIRQCRAKVADAGAGRDRAESEPVLALQALVALQSRGLPLLPAPDTATLTLARQGEALFHRRLGALELSCADCHDHRAGLRLGGSVIPQGHPTGYPLYRLEWQGLGSLGRRLRACVVGVRATPFAADGPEVLALEAYLARRAAGMVMDAPGLRP
jgi:sulfur-oxidizing protein SoxA